MKKITLLFAMMCSLTMFAEPQNGIIYVKPNATGKGTSWTDALGDIQTAIYLAKSSDLAARKDVWVATGEFTITSAINLIDSVNVYGGFIGTESAVTERAKAAGSKAWEFVNQTILKGSGARLMQVAGNFDMATIVDGFTMRDGNGVGSTLSTSGGAVVVRGNLVYQNCIMCNNSVVGSGGAATMTGGTIRYCLIENNTQITSANGGGGIFSNPATGTPSYIENCIVRGNSTTIRGAGIGVQGTEMTFVKNTRIYNNLAVEGTTLKGGAGIYANSAKNQISNCLVFNNTGSSAIYYNGGLFLNNTVVKNIGGIYIGANAITMANNIVWSCYTDAAGGSATGITGATNASATVHNNVSYTGLPTDKSWNLSNNILFSSNATNGDVEIPLPGAVASGPKLAKIHPFFGVTTVEADKTILNDVDFSLSATSPCKDKGKTLTEVAADILGVVRPQGTAYDMGAYEFSTISTSTNPVNERKSIVKITPSGFIALADGIIRVFSFNGELLKNEKMSLGKEIDLKPGAYIIQLKTNEGTFVQKFVF